MKIVVFGGRAYDKKKVYQSLSEAFSEGGTINRGMGYTVADIAELVHGAYGNTDWAADEWGKDFVPVVTPFKPDWDTYGFPAGPIRNQQMVDYGPDLALEFPGGKGTRDMHNRCVKNDIPIVRLY